MARSIARPSVSAAWAVGATTPSPNLLFFGGCARDISLSFSLILVLSSPQQIQLGVLSVTHRSNTTRRARGSKEIAIPRWLRGVGGQGAVGAVVVGELF